MGIIEYRYRFKGRDVGKKTRGRRRLIMEKLEDGNVIETRSCKPAEEMWDQGKKEDENSVKIS